MTDATVPDVPAVLVDSVSKEFRLPNEQVHTLKERALHPFRRSSFERFQALDNVSFAVQPGEFFGIVGRNGSGKSTLLKCLAGIYGTDSGQIYVNGRLSTFIELGVGFNPDLAARDNIMINAIMLGLTPSQAKERYERVIEFAELQDFTDLKLKNYSSGMNVRLAFSVMIEVDADILLIDEVLAVGDASFQQKCFDVFHDMRAEGRTILFVTHDMGSVSRFCDRGVLIEKGRLRAIGDPSEVANRYLELNFGRDIAEEQIAVEVEEPQEPDPAETEEQDEAESEGDGTRIGQERRFGDQSAEIVSAWFEDKNGEPRNSLRYGEEIVFKARIKFHKDFSDPLLGVTFENDSFHPVMATSTEWVDMKTGDFKTGERVIFTAKFENYFAPGRIYATPAVAYRGAGINWIDRRERLTSVVVTSLRDPGGNVGLPTDVTIEREN